MESVETAKGGEERVLNDVASILVVTDDSTRDNQQSWGIEPKEFFKRGVVAGSQFREQGRVVERVRARAALTPIECLH